MALAVCSEFQLPSSFGVGNAHGSRSSPHVKERTDENRTNNLMLDASLYKYGCASVGASQHRELNWPGHRLGRCCGPQRISKGEE